MTRTIVAALVALIAVTSAAAAPDYPDRPIKFMHGFPPGGNVDIIGRLLGNEMSKGLGQSIVIEPKPGVAPSPAQLARLVAAGKKSAVRAVVHEPYEPEDASRFMAQKLGVPFVLLATSVGSVPEAKDYFALFDHNVAALAKALGVPTQ